MTIWYMLDTNVLSEAIKSYPNEKTLEHLSDHDGQLATCSVVWHELSYGASRSAASKKRRAIEAYLEEAVRSTLPILPYDRERRVRWSAFELPNTVGRDEPTHPPLRP